MSAVTPTRKRFGIYEAHLASGELFKNGQKIRLQEQPFQVLIALLARPGEVVAREELRLQLWPSDTFVDFDHGLNTCINKLRDALGDTAANPRFIETVPRRGYRFIAPVQDMDAVAIPAALTEPPSLTEFSEMAVPMAAAPTPESEIPATSDEDLPKAPRKLSRTLFGLLQGMYLLFYASALWRLEEIGELGDTSGLVSGGVLQAVVLIAAVIGIPLRLYTLNATLFDYPKLGRNFQRLYPLVLPLDLLWALGPFLMVRHIGIGLAFAACAALLYSPFAQRVLSLMTWK